MSRFFGISRFFIYHLVGFFGFLGIIYGTMTYALHTVPFSTHDYEHNSYVYERLAIENKSLVHRLAVYDAQFYISVADHGYKTVTAIDRTADKPPASLLAYAFAPLYPLLLRVTTMTVGDPYAAALIMTILIAVACFISIWWLVRRWYAEREAARVTWLVMLLPSALFIYGYFSEALSLILLAGLLGAYRSEKIWWMAILTGLLSVTRFSFLVLFLVLLVWLLNRIRDRNISVYRAIGALAVSGIPLLLWAVVCYVLTDNPLQFISVREYWSNVPAGVLLSLVSFYQLPAHGFHESLLDLMAIITSGVLLFFSKKWLPTSWWWIAASLWAFPLLVTDTMSGFRYQLMLLPIYIWLGCVLKGKKYGIFIALSSAALLFFAAVGINYYWIG